MSDVILQMQNITKIYPNGFAANKDVNLTVLKGEIHALVGENGAGKTTLMRILFGLESAQEGKILVNGAQVHIGNPLDAISNGIGMVHQHFMQVPKFSVAENIILGAEPVKGPVFDQAKAVEIAREVAARYQFDIDVTSVLEDLSVGARQKVELLKALVRGVKILILDEPTAVLTPQETIELFGQLKKLKQMGISIVFISHKLEEVVKLCDRITVLRHGRNVATDDVKNLTASRIARMMVGRDVAFQRDAARREWAGRVVSVRDLVYINPDGRRCVDHVSFDLYGGEILGIAGIEGNGQGEIADILCGLLPLMSGSVEINGSPIAGKSVSQIRDLGVAVINEDRMKLGCAPGLSVKENILATRLRERQFRKGPFLDSKRVNAYVDKCIKDFEIMCDSRSALVRSLSGGNIQKVIIAREFSSNAKLIIANQPTRGIDIGTSEMVHKNLIDKARNEDVAVILISCDLKELLEVSDRLLVIRKGRFTAFLEDVAKVDEDLLGEYMLGARDMSTKEMEAALCADR